MDLAEARNAMLTMLAEKLDLTQGKNLFADALPPGVPEGVTVAVTGIREWHPDSAAECEMEITGTFESESVLRDHLAKLRDLLRNSCGNIYLDCRQNGLIRFAAHPGDQMDRKSFTFPLIIAFV